MSDDNIHAQKVDIPGYVPLCKMKNSASNLLDRVAKRIGLSSGWGSTTALATFFGVSPQTISTWRSRNKIPYSQLLKKRDKLGDINALLDSAAGAAGLPTMGEDMVRAIRAEAKLEQAEKMYLSLVSEIGDIMKRLSTQGG